MSGGRFSLVDEEIPGLSKSLENHDAEIRDRPRRHWSSRAAPDEAVPLEDGSDTGTEWNVSEHDVHLRSVELIHYVIKVRTASKAYFVGRSSESVQHFNFHSAKLANDLSEDDFPIDLRASRIRNDASCERNRKGMYLSPKAGVSHGS